VFSASAWGKVPQEAKIPPCRRKKHSHEQSKMVRFDRQRRGFMQPPLSFFKMILKTVFFQNNFEIDVVFQNNFEKKCFSK